MTEDARRKGVWHAEAVAMREAGATYTQIAKKFGVSVPAAYFAVNPDKRRVSAKKPAKALPAETDTVIQSQ